MTKKIPWEELFDAAARARTRAYAPYSKFQVGAAVLTGKGVIHAACNVENSSYGLSLCAERSAIAQAVAAGAKEIRAVAIVVDTKAPCPPCGMCRQVIAEFGDADVPVRSRTLRGKEARYTLATLLPHAFTKSFL